MGGYSTQLFYPNVYWDVDMIEFAGFCTRFQRVPISPPYLYVKALIIQGFFVSVFLKKIPAHTLAHTLDGSVFFRPKADFSTVSKRCSPGAIRRSI